MKTPKRDYILVNKLLIVLTVLSFLITVTIYSQDQSYLKIGNYEINSSNSNNGNTIITTRTDERGFQIKELTYLTWTKTLGLTM